MKNFIYSIIFAFLIPATANHAFSQPEVTTALEERMSQKDDDSFIPLNIRLSQQYDIELLKLQSHTLRTGEARRKFVTDQLKSFSHDQQSELIEWLEQMQKLGLVQDITPLWIANIVHCKAKPEVIAELMYRKDLARLDYDQVRYVLIDDQQNTTLDASASDPKTGLPVWSVIKVNAPLVWEQGFKGQDVIVAVMDTGVNYNHQDLQGNMWVHPDFPFHGYNFIENNTNPMDFQGHGTHVAGTVAGQGTSGNSTGMAPEATIMAIKILNNSGSGSESGVWSGVQFAVENGANVLSLSLGWKHAWSPDRASWRTVFSNASAAGVISAVASGNEGTSSSDLPPSEVRTPGDVPAPWLHPDQTTTGGTSGVVSVGSSTNADGLSSFSSKGPVTWQSVSGFNDYPYNPGMGLIRPDIVAPGSDILSLTHNNNSGYTAKSGTSMATPAVAGVMALMLSKNPHLTPEDISRILEESAISMSPTKSNYTGSGRMDALAAITQTSFVGINFVEHSLNDSQGNNDGKINPGETIKLNLTLQNPTEEAIESVMVRISTPSPYITFNYSLVTLGDFPEGSTIDFDDIITFQVSDSIPGNHIIGFSLDIYKNGEADNVWKSVFSDVAFAPELSISEIVVDDSEHGNGNGLLDPGETALIKVNITNTGQIDSDPLTLDLGGYLPFVLVEQPQITSLSIDSGSDIWVEYQVTIHEVVNPGTPSDFELSLASGAYRSTKDFTLKIGQIIEKWESGDFLAFDWQQQGSANWYMVTNISHDGMYSARSGSINHAQESVLVLEYDVLAHDSIAFFRKVSSENNYDWLEFYIDNERVARWSGNRDWERVMFPVEPGSRTFKWVYIKDGSVSDGSDCAWVDHIELPARASTTAFAGFPAQECDNTNVQLNGFAMHFDSMLWTTDGDGTFTSPQDVNSVYIPGQQDLAQGSVTLSIEVQYQQQPAVLHSMPVEFIPAPAPQLGDDVVLCRRNTLELNASQGQGNYTYLWQDGSTQEIFIVNPEIYPEDQITVWVEVTGTEGCIGTDTLNITFDECVNVYEPENDIALLLFPNPASEKVNISFYSTLTQKAVISLSNISGQTVRTINTEIYQGQAELEFNLSGLDKGIYFLTITSEQFSETRKLIVQ